jgi:hypothetical protein
MVERRRIELPTFTLRMPLPDHKAFEISTYAHRPRANVTHNDPVVPSVPGVRHDLVTPG